MSILIADFTGGVLGQHYRLTVMPQRIRITSPQNVRRDVFISKGETVDIGYSKPREISFDSFFPRFADTYTEGEANSRGELLIAPLSNNPERSWVDIMQRLERKVLSVAIFELKIIGTYIMSRDFELMIIGGHGDDIEYRMSLVEYEPATIRRIDTEAEIPVEVSTVFASEIQRVTNYLVRPNDTWLSISQQVGVPAPEIMSHNGIVNWFELTPGQVLSIP